MQLKWVFVLLQLTFAKWLLKQKPWPPANMADELSLFIYKTVVTLDVVVLFQHRQSFSIFFKFNICFPMVVVFFQMSPKLLTSVSACYGISNVFYLKQGFISVTENWPVKHPQKKKDIIKSSLFSALVSCSNHGTVVHITLKVQCNNPCGMANVEF